MHATVASPQSNESPTRAPYAPWELGLAAVAALIALGLGLANIEKPSFWHDELVHLFVAKSIAETGVSALPSGTPYTNGTTYNYILAAVVKVWGATEGAARSPSAFFAACNVLLTFFCIRPLLGRSAALIAAFALALSPWSVAWSREARFYTLQQGLYLATVLAFWNATQSRTTRRAYGWGGGALAVYAAGLLTSFHSSLFLGGVGAFAGLMLLSERKGKSRWTVICLALAVAGAITVGAVTGLMNPLDRGTVVDRGGLGGGIVDAERAVRTYYTHWLRLNLSTGFYLLALFGFAAMIYRERSRGLYAALAFWIPIAVLTLFIGYRRPRFMFFAYPFYVAAYAYAGVVLLAWLATPKRDWLARSAWVIVVLFMLRLGVSAYTLANDSIDAARGADTTLARRHPQWREPSAYVRENLDGAVVVTTTYLPALHYIGQVDNWYPTEYLWWEEDETGYRDLETFDDFKEYVRSHPKGFYIAEWWRWDRNDFLSEEVVWVEAHLRRIDEASSDDVTVYAWGP